MSARPACYKSADYGGTFPGLSRPVPHGPRTPRHRYASWRTMYSEWRRLNPTPRKGGAMRRLIQRFKRAFGVK